MVVTQSAKSRLPRKQQQRSVQTQEKLLDAAIEAFSENGFKGTSTRDIADRAGVHHPLITYHFKNKEELWRAATNRVFARFTAARLQASDHDTGQGPRDRMAAMIRSHVNYAAKNPALYRLVQQESSQASSRLEWLVETHLQPLCEVVVKKIEALQQYQIVPAGNPALLFNLLRVMSGGMIAMALEIKGTCDIDFDEQDNVDALAEIIIRIFLSGPS